jgi:hypothetical protein
VRRIVIEEHKRQDDDEDEWSEQDGDALGDVHVDRFSIDKSLLRSYILREAYVDYCTLQLAVPVARKAIPFGQLLASRSQCA